MDAVVSCVGWYSAVFGGFLNRASQAPCLAAVLFDQCMTVLCVWQRMQVWSVPMGYPAGLQNVPSSVPWWSSRRMGDEYRLRPQLATVSPAGKCGLPVLRASSGSLGSNCCDRPA